MLGIVMAAGKGTRMKSEKPKVMHEIAGKPIISWVMGSLWDFFNMFPDNSTACVVIGPEGKTIVDTMDEKHDKGRHNLYFKEQKTRNGTGGAVLCSRVYLETIGRDEYVLVLNGDVPFIKPSTLFEMKRRMENHSADALVLTVDIKDPSGYGRVKKEEELILKIIEHRDANEDERKITEINTGIYLFKAGALLDSLAELKNDNVQKEYYLTDTVSILNGLGYKAISMVCDDEFEVAGVNDRVQLASLEAEIRSRILEEHMKNGVTITDKHTTYIDPGVYIGCDTVVHPMTFIKTGSVIGSNCIIGPMTQIENTVIGDFCTVDRSHIKGAKIHDRISVGPFARIREGTSVEDSCKIGDFVELKNTVMKKGSKAQHLSYLGDAFIGEGVNIGAGTITCNYDGYNKHKTNIGNGAFIGSNSSLVAPVNIGAGAIVGAGSVITEDVSVDSLALARSRQVEKEKRASLIREELKRKKESR